MVRTQLRWLIAVLAATPAFYAACGGDDSTSTTTGGAGTAGSTGSGGSGGSSTTGTGGSSGSSGTAGSPDGGGKAGSSGGTVADSGFSDARTPCGTARNGGCAASPSSGPMAANVCDLPNNRCVACLADSDCADETTAKHCDMTPSMIGMMLPRDTCVECLDNTQCPMGATCIQNACRTSCGTTMNGCTTDPQGNDICDTANNRCVDCMTDADCAVKPTAPHCDTRPNPMSMAMLPYDTCRQCLDNSQCGAGQVCNTNYTCINACTSDTDCASRDGGGGPQAPHCNPTTMTCRPCATDAHCTNMMAPICTDTGTCVQCTNDSQCASQMNRPYCQTTNNTCVQCTDNSQCTPPATCNGRGSCTGGGMMDGGRGGMDSGGGAGGAGGGTVDSGGGTAGGTIDSGGGTGGGSVDSGNGGG